MWDIEEEKDLSREQGRKTRRNPVMCPRAAKILLVPFLIFCFHVLFREQQELAVTESSLSQARGGARDLICISSSNPCSLARSVGVSSLHKRGKGGSEKPRNLTTETQLVSGGVSNCFCVSS